MRPEENPTSPPLRMRPEPRRSGRFLFPQVPTLKSKSGNTRRMLTPYNSCYFPIGLPHSHISHLSLFRPANSAHPKETRSAQVGSETLAKARHPSAIRSPHPTRRSPKRPSSIEKTPAWGEGRSADRCLLKFHRPPRCPLPSSDAARRPPRPPGLAPDRPRSPHQAGGQLARAARLGATEATLQMRRKCI